MLHLTKFGFAANATEEDEEEEASVWCLLSPSSA